MPNLKQKRLLLIGAGHEQLAALRAAQQLGLFVIALDGNPHAPGLSQADEGICVDIRDVEAVTKIGKDATVDGVFSHAVDLPFVVAIVAQHLRVPGLDPDIALRASNKHLRYQCFQNRSVPCPQFFLVASVEAALAQAEMLGYPLVMKPLDCAGARGIRKVSGPNEVEEGFNLALSFSQEPSVLIEEFLEGPEISTESVIIDGQIITTGFADRNYSKKEMFAPYFIEDGHTIPTDLSADEQAGVIQVIEQAIQALDITWGVAKGDIILTTSGPKIFEMTPRTSGGRFCADMVPLATGVDILPFLIAMSVGESPSIEDLHPKIQRGAAQRFLFPEPGEIVDVNGMADSRDLPGIYDVVLQEGMMPGGRVPPMTNHGDRIGHVIAAGDTRDEAVRRAECAVDSIRIETRSLAKVDA